MENLSVKLNEIELGPNHRSDELTDLSDLMNSIKNNGLINPVTVRPGKKKNKPYCLVAGFRRFMCHRKLGLKTIDVRVLEEMDSGHAKIINLVENAQRKSTTLREQGLLMKDLIDNEGYTEKEIASKMDMTLGYVRSCLNVVKSVPAKYKGKITYARGGAIKAGEISASIADKITTVSKEQRLTSRQVGQLYSLAEKGVLTTSNASKVAPMIKTTPPEDIIKRLEGYATSMFLVSYNKSDVKEKMNRFGYTNQKDFFADIIYGIVDCKLKRADETN